MLEWKPISLKTLSLHIELQEFLLTEEVKAFWHFIRIEPERWVDESYHQGPVKFFVIAIFGHKVIYYNDMEEGFNVSQFEVYGRLKGGGANQNDFAEYISGIFPFLSSGRPSY